MLMASETGLTQQQLSKAVRKQLRKALEASFTSFVDMSIFVDEELDLELSTISSPQKGLLEVVQDLLMWIKVQGQQQEVIDALCAERAANPEVKQLQQLLSQQATASSPPLVPVSSRNLVCPELSQLLETWNSLDLSYLDTAFFDSFLQIYGTSDLCLYDRPLIELSPLQSALGKISKPQFFLTFIQKLLWFNQSQTCSLQLENSLQRALEQLGSQLAEQHELPWESDGSVESATLDSRAKAYLLIALVSCNRTSNGEEEFTIWPELWLEQGTAPIDFENEKHTRVFSEVPGVLSKLIEEAEKKLENCECNGVIVEVLLPREYIEQDIFKEWQVKDDFQELTALGFHRAVVVRSVDRINFPSIWQSQLQANWERLQQDIQACAITRHSSQPGTIPTDRGALKTLLKNTTILQLPLPLSTEAEARQMTLSDIVQSPLPLAFWFKSGPDDPAQGLKVIDRLLSQSSPIQTATLAEAWAQERATSTSPLSQDLCLLVEHPIRRPTFRPNKDPTDPNNTDLLVAS